MSVHQAGAWSRLACAAVVAALVSIAGATEACVAQRRASSSPLAIDTRPAAEPAVLDFGDPKGPPPSASEVAEAYRA
jgi:hypothetical protein